MCFTRGGREGGGGGGGGGGGEGGVGWFSEDSWWERGEGGLLRFLCREKALPFLLLLSGYNTAQTLSTPLL